MAASSSTTRILFILWPEVGEGVRTPDRRDIFVSLERSAARQRRRLALLLRRFLLRLLRRLRRNDDGRPALNERAVRQVYGRAYVDLPGPRVHAPSDVVRRGAQGISR